MELLYLWVDGHNNLRKFGVNFSNDYDIQFIPESNTLTIEEVKKEKPNIFNPAFLNITALIGKNGVGKTTVLSEVKYIFSSEYFSFNRDLFVVRQSDSEIVVFHQNANRDNKLEVKSQSIQKEDIRVSDDINGFMSKVSLLNYSSGYTTYQNYIAGERYMDISFDAILKHFSLQSNSILIERYDELLEAQKDVKGENQKNKEKFDLYRKFIINQTLPQYFIYDFEMKAIIKFLSENLDNKKFSFIPGYLLISFNYNFFRKNEHLIEEIGLNNPTNYQKVLTEIVYDHKPETLKELFKNNLSVFLLLFAFKNNLFLQSPKINVDQVIDRLNQINDFKTIPESIQEIFVSCGDISSNMVQLYWIVDLFKNFDKEYDSFANIFSGGNNKFGFSITDSLLTSLSKIFKFWYDEEPLFHFDWGGRSAGEYAMLSLFSRINWVNPMAFYDFVWILIDEGELYLHPEWQRSFFNDLHKYLPIFFKNKKVQLFLTSHSPFVVSDLPLDNIILMDRDENGKGIIVDKKSLGSTFGANIHTLLSNAFFMKNGQMGEFAKTKIFELLEEIESTESFTEDDVKIFEQRIKIIGEPTIRQKLQEKLYEKVGQDLLLQKKIELEKELQQIDQKIKNRNHEAG